MPRKPRVILPNHPVHVIQRGNNRSATFYTEEDYRFYYDALSKASQRCECAVHAYVLMTNHVHLLLSSSTEIGISAFMQSVGRRYVRYINQTYRRSGTLWEGRFKSSLIQDNEFYFICSRYIEMNPVRAGMVSHPKDYRWSSYGYNAQGEVNSLIKPYQLYIRLGKTDQERASCYTEMFNEPIDLKTIGKIRTATNKEQVLGNDRFREEIGRMLQRRIDTHPHGGDRKSETFKQVQSQYIRS